MKKELFLCVLLTLVTTFCANAQFSGGNGSVSNPWQIATVADLVLLAETANNGESYGKYFIQTADIDLADWCANNAENGGWNPIGRTSFENAFWGTFNGNNKIIQNLTINRPTENYIGLFGFSMGTIQNVGIENCNIKGNGYVGGLCGMSYYTVTNSYSTGIVDGNATVGGLVGFSSGFITNSYSTCQVSGSTIVGGLCGSNSRSGPDGLPFISNCYSTGSVNGTSSRVGGLAGINDVAIYNSYTISNVNGNNAVGGLVGELSSNSAIIQNCIAANDTVSATENITTINRIVGNELYSGSYNNNYAKTNVVLIGNGAIINRTDDATINGTSKETVILKSLEFYNTANNWYSNTPWSIDAISDSEKIWKICDHTTLPFFQWQENMSCPYIITASAGVGGSIDPEGNTIVNHGNDQTFTITPNSGYKIAQVLVDGVNNTAAVINGNYTFSNIVENHSIAASFERITPIITASASTGGIISPVGNIAVNYGTNKTFNFTAHLGYVLKEVLVDGENQPEAVTNGSYTFTHITNDHIIVANFERIKFVITATVGENGNITPSGEVDVYYGNNQEFTITPNEGYAIQSILVDGVNKPVAVNAGSYTFSNVRAAHTIEATFVQAQYTITAMAGAGGSITPDGIIGAIHGDSKTFFIVPNAGYKITQVVVDGIPNQEAMCGSFTFYNISASHSISATFELSYSTITATADENGIITPAGSTQVLYGQSQYYVIVPHFGYKIATVLVDGVNNAAAVESGSYLFTNVTVSHIITATFERIPHTIVSEATAGGSIFPNGITQVANGDSLSYTITTNEGYNLTKVLVDGVNDPIADTSGTYTFYNISDNHTIKAIFEIKKDTIEAIAGIGGQIFPNGISIVNHNSSKTYTFFPNTGYVIDSVFVDNKADSMAAVNGVYTFDTIKQNHTIMVSFKIKTFDIIAKVEGGNGTITPNDTTTVDYGSSQMYTFAPNAGYRIVEILVDGVVKPNAVQNGSYIFNNVITNHEIIAKFDLLTDIDEDEMIKLTIYPNPTNGQLTITNYGLRIEQIRIFDIMGKMVVEQKAEGEKQDEIDISHFPEGMYFIQIQTDSGMVTKKVVKQ